MSLEDEYHRLVETPSVEEQQYVPRTEFDGSSGFIQTASFPAEQAPDFTAILTQFGYDPAQVKIVGQPRVSRWQQRSQVRDHHGQRTGEYETVWLCAYRFHLAPVDAQAGCDLEALIKDAKRTPREFGTRTDGYWFVFQAGDLQLGKRSRDGSTEQIVERYLQSVESAKQELKQSKRHGIAGVQISLPGDCIEGNQSQSGKNLWLTQETITEQTRMFRRLLLHTVDEFACASKVYLDVVNGNHDQAQREQNTYPGDGWATEAAVAVSDALKLNPKAYGHVEVRIPDKWSGCMTVPVGDSVVTVVHGHQWRRNQAWKWWADQSVNNQPAGAAQVLQNGHYHEWAVESSATKTRIQSSTLDCGSDWYRDKTGAEARRGALVYLLKSGEVSRMSLL